MASPVIVVPYIIGYSLVGFPAILIFRNVNLLVFQCSPKPLDKYIIQCSTPTVPADLRPFIFKYANEPGTGKL